MPSSCHVLNVPCHQSRFVAGRCGQLCQAAVARTFVERTGTGELCTCNFGYNELGSIGRDLTFSVETQSYTTCEKIPCPPLTKGDGGGQLCACIAGYFGDVSLGPPNFGSVTFHAPSNTYNTTCYKVECPDHTDGHVLL